MTEVNETVVVYRKRNNVGLFLLLLALALGISSYVLVGIGIDRTPPANWPWVTGIWAALGLVAHLALRFRLPYADPVILPIVFALCGIGLSMIHRIDVINSPPRHDATTQLIWVGLGVAAMIVVSLIVRDHRGLQGYPYILFLVGLTLLLLPMTPLGVEINGSQIWIRVAGLSFQPAEVAKIVLSFAFAAYLAEKKDVLALAGPRVLGITLPRGRDLGPIAIMWAASMLVLVSQKDLGTSLLFFGLFVMMVYVATERLSWVVIGGLAFAAGAVVAYERFGHVRVRVSSWLDPFSDFDKNYQVIQGQFGMAWGGLFGRGWGQGRPGLIPLAKSDFITAAVGEELGIVGLMAVIVLYGVMVARGLRTALAVSDPFGKLLASGLAFVFALQAFAIIGGVTRLLPLTGLTTPFMSQGGSSMVANWIVVAAMLIISHQARRPALQPVITEVAELDAESTQIIHVTPRPEPTTPRRWSRWQRGRTPEPGAPAALSSPPAAALGDEPEAVVRGHAGGVPVVSGGTDHDAEAATQLIAAPPVPDSQITVGQPRSTPIVPPIGHGSAPSNTAPAGPLDETQQIRAEERR